MQQRKGIIFPRPSLNNCVFFLFFLFMTFFCPFALPRRRQLLCKGIHLTTDLPFPGNKCLLMAPARRRKPPLSCTGSWRDLISRNANQTNLSFLRHPFHFLLSFYDYFFLCLTRSTKFFFPFPTALPSHHRSFVPPSVGRRHLFLEMDITSKFDFSKRGETTRD